MDSYRLCSEVELSRRKMIRKLIQELKIMQVLKVGSPRRKENKM